MTTTNVSNTADSRDGMWLYFPARWYVFLLVFAFLSQALSVNARLPFLPSGMILRGQRGAPGKAPSHLPGGPKDDDPDIFRFATVSARAWTARRRGQVANFNID